MDTRFHIYSEFILKSSVFSMLLVISTDKCPFFFNVFPNLRQLPFYMISKNVYYVQHVHLLLCMK